MLMDMLYAAPGCTGGKVYQGVKYHA